MTAPQERAEWMERILAALRELDPDLKLIAVRAGGGGHGV